MIEIFRETSTASLSWPNRFDFLWDLVPYTRMAQQENLDKIRSTTVSQTPIGPLSDEFPPAARKPSNTASFWKIAVACVLLLAAAVLWFNRYSYTQLRLDDLVFPVRTSRITGEAEIFYPNTGWTSLNQPKQNLPNSNNPAPP
jgi:hypothetical protein